MTLTGIDDPRRGRHHRRPRPRSMASGCRGPRLGGLPRHPVRRSTRRRPPLRRPRASPPVGRRARRDRVRSDAPARRPPAITLIPEPSLPGESTLNVNVFTPAPATDAGLPVLVYIHGGGLPRGLAGEPVVRRAALQPRRRRHRLDLLPPRLRRLRLDRGCPAQPRRARLAARARVGARQHRGLRRRPRPGHDRRAVGGRRCRADAARHARGAAPVPAGVLHLGAPADVALDRAERSAAGSPSSRGVEPTRAGLSTLGEERVLELQKQVAEPAGRRPLAHAARFIDDGLPSARWSTASSSRPTLDAIAGGRRRRQAARARHDRRRVLDGHSTAEGKLRWVPPDSSSGGSA